MQRIRDWEVLSPKWDSYITFLPSRLRNLYGKSVRASVQEQWPENSQKWWNVSWCRQGMAACVPPSGNEALKIPRVKQRGAGSKAWSGVHRGTKPEGAQLIQKLKAPEKQAWPSGTAASVWVTTPHHVLKKLCQPFLRKVNWIDSIVKSLTPEHLYWGLKICTPQLNFHIPYLIAL